MHSAPAVWCSRSKCLLCRKGYGSGDGRTTETTKSDLGEARKGLGRGLGMEIGTRKKREEQKEVLQSHSSRSNTVP